MRNHLRPRGLTAGFAGRIALIDGVIHHQDIRRPLGMPRDIPTDRMLIALSFDRAAPTIGPAKRIRGLTLIASDLNWIGGNGLAESLLMAIAGRHGTAQELTGPGHPSLARRLETGRG